MEKRQNNKILENRVSLRDPAATEVFCPSCDESLIFAMQNQFSLGLSTVLECLALAEKAGHVPLLPSEWWISLSARYHSVGRMYQHIHTEKD